MSKEVLGKDPLETIPVPKVSVLAPCRPDGEVIETDYDTKKACAVFA